MYDKLSFLKGLALGLAGKPLEFAPGKEPVPDAPEQPTAFFYGHAAKDGETPTRTFDGVGYVGVVLQAVPGLDLEKYPYMYLIDYSKGPGFPGQYSLCVSSSEPSYLHHPASGSWAVSYERKFYTSYYGLEWKERNDADNAVVLSAIEWANFSLMNEDGTVYQYEANLIPIYE